jgi:hypothetical protein
MSWLGKLNHKYMKCSTKLLLVTKLFREHRLLIAFLDLGMGKLWLKILSGICPKVTEIKMYRNFATSSV